MKATTRTITIGEHELVDGEEYPDDRDPTPWIADEAELARAPVITEKFMVQFRGKATDGFYQFNLHFTDGTALEIYLTIE